MWFVFLKHSFRVKPGPLGGVLGFELTQARQQITAGGVQPGVADELLAACEAAAVTALNEKDEDPDG